MSVQTLELVPVDVDTLALSSDSLADGAIIGAASDARTARVTTNGRRDALQAHDARAWTMSGNVD